LLGLNGAPLSCVHKSELRIWYIFFLNSNSFFHYYLLLLRFLNLSLFPNSQVVAVSDAHSEYSLPMLRASSSSGNAPSPINLAGMGRAKAPATKGSNTSGSSAAAAALEVAGSSEEDSGAVVVRNLSADESRAWVRDKI